MSRKKRRVDRAKNHSSAISAAQLRPKRKAMVLPAVVISAAVILSTVLFYLYYIRGTASGGFGAYRDHNVLLITVDTLRADHLPVYGYGHVKTPNIDSLAENSLIFEDAMAHVPLTLPSHASILTGLVPPSHGVRDNAFNVLDSTIVTLAESMRSSGYATAAFVSSVILDSDTQIDQGFEYYYDNFDDAVGETVLEEAERHAEDTVSGIETWLSENQSKKFFLWTHFFDPHDPYDPPEPYKSEYKGRPYDGEIAYTDANLGRLFAKLDELGLRDHTIILLTSDHGESLGEHGELTHGLLLYEAALRVPLLISLPGGREKRIRDLVRHVDLTPTILEWLGLSSIPNTQGRSLVPYLSGTDETEQASYAESKYGEIHYGWSPLTTISTGEYRFIEAPRAELYDRKKDPSEVHNLIHEKAATAKVLRERLEDFIRKSSRGDAQQTRKMDPETEEKLRALGYISSSAPATDRQIDPKDKISLHAALIQAYAAIRAKNHQHVIQLLEPVLKEGPNMIEAHYFMGLAYAGIQDYARAIDEFLKTVSLRPDHTMALYNLAYAYQVVGKLSEAEQWYQQIFKYEEKFRPADIKLAHLYRSMRMTDKATYHFKRAIQNAEQSLKRARKPEAQSRILSELAEIYFVAGDWQQAEKNLVAAIQLTPKKAMLHFNLAQVSEAKNDPTRAIIAYKKEAEIDPSNFMAWYNLGLIYRQSNRLEDAIQCFQRVLQIVPDNIPACYLLAESYHLAGRNLDEALLLAKKVVDRQPEFENGRLLLAAVSKRLNQTPQPD